jgi:hypothetical protein
MDGRTDLDTLLGAEAAGQPEHFGAIRLHREIAEGAGVRFGGYLHAPAEHRV